ncbi:amidohydrolase [soil metagenome]
MFLRTGTHHLSDPGARLVREVAERHARARWAAPLVLLAAAVTEPCASAEAAGSEQPAAPFPSTYEPGPRHDTVITGGTILDGAGRRYARGSIRITNGRIDAIGDSIPETPKNPEHIDAQGRWITPGLIDPHSHLGTASLPLVPIELEHWDVNEPTDPNTAQVRAEHSVHTQDPSFERALAGGVTTLQILPGSSNLFGGRGVVLKNVPAATVQAMKFPGAPPSMKMACGENPKYTHGEAGRAPASRMGVVAGMRAAWQAAREYAAKQERGSEDDGEQPARDFRLETLAAALDGEILIHVHCYRADDMAIMLDVADEYGFQIAGFHHASEAYKIADLLAREQVCAVVWSDWWGYKMEAYDAVRANAAIVDAAGGCVSLHSDSAVTGQHLNLEAAKALAAGRRAGLELTREQAVRWITQYPAKLLGLDDRIGTLEPGKNADLVVWSGDPFSVYSRVDLVFIDGVLVYDRSVTTEPRSDFELGQPARAR